MHRHLRYQVLEGTFGLHYDDFEPTTGMFKTRDGHFDSPKWPSSVVKQGEGVEEHYAHDTGPSLAGRSLERSNRSGKRAKSYSQRPAYWRCANNHVFVQSSNNIRRKRGSARKCSWCPECTRSGLRFEWEKTAAEKSFASKQLKIKASREDEANVGSGGVGAGVVIVCSLYTFCTKRY